MILDTALWLGEGVPVVLAETPRATVVCLKGKLREFGPRLELPAARGLVYVGRRFTMGGWRLAASDWANPFTVKAVGSAKRAVELYAQWLPTRPELMARLGELRGCRLGCWCVSGPCHARHLADLANALPDPDAPAAVKPRKPQRLPGWALR